MADTAHKDSQYMEEHHDSESELTAKVDRLARYVRDASHMIAFTGAGISTSAGIPDFRGPDGKWTCQAQGRIGPQGKSTLCALPTPTHMSLVALQQHGILKHLVSQNCDGLHRRSGFPTAALSELHGNGNVEECEDCGQQYYRDAKCRRAGGRGRDHATGRRCVREGCGGRLLEWTIDFGQDLPMAPLEAAQHHASRADLCLAMGSSLTVTPAAGIPEAVGRRRKDRLVIVNLQETPLTGVADFQIFARTDVVMQMLMQRLGLAVPPFKLRRRVELSATPQAPQASGAAPGATLDVRARGVDLEDPSLPVSILRSVVATSDAVAHAPRLQAEDDGAGAHTMRLPASDAPQKQLTLSFPGHYSEPPVTVPVAPLLAAGRVCLDLEYDPAVGAWAMTRCDEGAAGDAAVVQASRPRDNRFGVSHREYVNQGKKK